MRDPLAGKSSLPCHVALPNTLLALAHVLCCLGCAFWLSHCAAHAWAYPTDKNNTEEAGNINKVFKTVWPSGLRRWLKAPFRKGVGSNPTAVTLAAPFAPQSIPQQARLRAIFSVSPRGARRKQQLPSKHRTWHIAGCGPWRRGATIPPPRAAKWRALRVERLWHLSTLGGSTGRRKTNPLNPQCQIALYELLQSKAMRRHEAWQGEIRGHCNSAAARPRGRWKNWTNSCPLQSED